MTSHTEPMLMRAVCGCGLEAQLITRQWLKKEWPVCYCDKPMRIENVSTESLPDCLRMGNARRVPEPVRRDGDSD